VDRDPDSTLGPAIPPGLCILVLGSEESLLLPRDVMKRWRREYARSPGDSFGYRSPTVCVL